MNGGLRRLFGPPTSARKDRDDDLVLFREIFRLEKERNVSLLQPVSDDFDPSNGSHSLYRIPSGRRVSGQDLVVAEAQKNDYNWLKTPPETPLFLSLEMEANDPNLVTRKELRTCSPTHKDFKGKLEESKPNHRQKPPTSKSLANSRLVTPTRRPSSLSDKVTKYGGILDSNHKFNRETSDSSREVNSNTTIKKSTTPKANTLSSTTSNLSKTQNSDSKPRCITHWEIENFGNNSRIPSEAPLNLITNTAKTAGRATSASRGRLGNAIVAPTETKLEPEKSKKYSCSPSVTKGRNIEIKQDGEQNSAMKAKTKGGYMIVGSQMVERVMNARRPKVSGGR